MALTAFLCSNDSGTVEERRQDFKYLKTASKMTEPAQPESKKGKSNPFRRKPRGQKSDIVQIIQHPNKTFQKKSVEGVGKKQSFPHHPQQSIGTFASGLKENGTRFLKNHHPFKRNLMAKKTIISKQSKVEEQVDCEELTTPTQPLPLDKSLKSPDLTCHLTKLNCCVSCDSGNGDDLSSSCDSSVVTDTNGLQKCPSNLQLNQMESIVSEEEMSPEEEVFMDALSNISSDDEEYVTPLSSRSSSITCLTNPSSNSLSVAKESFIVSSHSSDQSLHDVNKTLTDIDTTSSHDTTLIETEECDKTHNDSAVDETESPNTLKTHTNMEHSLQVTINDSSHINDKVKCPGLLFLPEGLILNSQSNNTCTDPLSSERSLSPLPQSTSPLQQDDSLSCEENVHYNDTTIINETTLSTIERITYTPTDNDVLNTQQYSANNNTNTTSITSDSIPVGPCTVCTRHLLYYEWVLWYDKLTTGRPQFSDYAAHLQKISSITTVEEFWSIINNLLPPSQLVKNANYHFFKEGTQPLWEDEANKNGGKWVITFKTNNALLDRIWLEVLMALIGEHFEKSHLITGVVLSRRKKGDRIALWTTVKNKSSNLQICKQLLRVLSIASNISICSYDKFVTDIANDSHMFNLVYMLHKDSLRTGTSYQNQPHLTLKQHLTILLK